MLTDLVLSPFGADPGEMVRAAEVADGAAGDGAGFAGVYTFDHFSGTVAGRPWSRDPFVVLGAVAARTRRVRLSVLVANVVNRHPAQLASAVDTLQALAPGRVVCGIGSGAAPGSRFAVESELIGRRLGDGAERRARLAEAIATLRAMWAGGPGGVAGVVDGSPAPPIVIGASGPATVTLAARIADGVNIRPARPSELGALIALARTTAGERSFEISVLDEFDARHPLGGDPAALADLAVDRRCLVVAPPYPLDAIARAARALAARPAPPFV